VGSSTRTAEPPELRTPPPAAQHQKTASHQLPTLPNSNVLPYHPADCHHCHTTERLLSADTIERLHPSGNEGLPLFAAVHHVVIAGPGPLVERARRPYGQAEMSMTVIPSADTCQAPSCCSGLPLYAIAKATTTPP
jgi:hypothetical protein